MLFWIAVLATLAAPAQAHRLDEYLQASLISLEPDTVRVELNLTPGVAVLASVVALIDLDRDGSFSPAEQQAYANRVLGDVSLKVDRLPRVLTVTSAQFPPIEQMQAGLGTIRMVLRARFEALQPGPHVVYFENRHQPDIGVFLANALVPRESISIARQSRDYKQTAISIDYSVSEFATTRYADSRVLFAAFLCTAALCGFFVQWRGRRNA